MIFWKAYLNFVFFSQNLEDKFRVVHYHTSGQNALIRVASDAPHVHDYSAQWLINGAPSYRKSKNENFY